MYICVSTCAYVYIKVYNYGCVHVYTQVNINK